MAGDEQRLARIERKLDGLSEQVGDLRGAVAAYSKGAEGCERRFQALEATVYSRHGLRDTVSRLDLRNTDSRKTYWLLLSSLLTSALALIVALLVAMATGGTSNVERPTSNAEHRTLTPDT